MPRAASVFDRFLRAVHRRLVIVRTLEWGGLGALAGCVAAGAMMPLLLWRGQAALAPAEVLIALGLLAGLLWGVTHRPSALSAAIEADRQLDLHDLLSTAASVGGGARDPWAKAVVAVAEQRCLRHAPSQVVLHRYGSRAWGGIALAAALVLTLATMFNAPGDRPAVASQDSWRSAVNPSADQARATEPLVASVGRGANPVGENSVESRNVGPDDESNTTPRDDQGMIRQGVSSSNGRSNATGQDGKGGGVGTRPDRRAASAGPATPPPGAASNGHAPEDRLAKASGGGAHTGAHTGADGADAAGSSTASQADTSNRIAPWESANWPDAARGALDAIEAGRVPDAYRDLVRDYFDR